MKKLKRLQRHLSRKVKGSKNRDIEFVPVFTTAITELIAQGYQDDLHLGNIMIRNKHTIVINDPVQ